MSFLVILGMCILGWGLSHFLKLPLQSRLILSGGIGYASTATLLQIFWLVGIPFYALSFVWWVIVGSLFGWYGLGWWQKRRGIQERVFKDIFSAIQRLKVLELSWQLWPLIIIATVCGFSLLIMFVWSITVRPVTWDNLSLYDSRARLLGMNTSLEELKNRYSWDTEAARYDFMHPLGGSLVNALAYQVEGDFVSVVTIPLLLSVLGLPFLLWKNWSSRWTFWLLLTSSRLLFEQSIEGYAGWPAALLWFLGIGVLMIWNTQREKKWLLLAGVFIAGTQTLRTHEPFWAVLSVCWIVWQVLEKRTWKIPVGWQILPWLTLIEWAWIRRGVYQAAAQILNHSTLRVTEALSQPPFITTFLDVLWKQKDFWPFFILLLLFYKRSHLKELPFFLLLLLMWLGVLVGGAGYLIWSHPATGPEFVLAWPRASLPIIALLMLLVSSMMEKKETKRL